MEAWQKWVIVVAGIVAIIDQWSPDLWLNVIGGLVAAVVALIAE